MKPIEEDTPGQRIANLCKDYGISQKELAEKIGLSAPQLSRIISGKTPGSDIPQGGRNSND